MLRRSMFKLLAASVTLAPLAARAADGEKKIHKLAIHIDQNDPEIMKLALNNARNAHELYQKRGEEIAIEIVTYGPGLHMLREDTSPMKDEIHTARKNIPRIAFAACNNTKTGMEKKEGKAVSLMSEAILVDAGVVRLIELQEQGYAYVKP